MKNRVYLSKTPEIFYIDKFITNKEVEHIIDVSKNNLKKANVSFLKKDASNYKNFKGRTNKSYWLDKKSDPIVLKIM